MRIAIVVSELDERSGGMGAWCGQFVAALARQGHDVHVVAQRFWHSPWPRGVTPHLLAEANSRMSFAQNAERYLERHDFDVVHDMGAGWSCDFFQPHGGSHFAWNERRLDMYPAWLRAVKRPVDAILPRHKDFRRHCKRQFAQTSHSEKRFIALSQSVANDFVRFHDVRPDQIAIVYNGVDCERFSPAHRDVWRASVRCRLGVADETAVLLLAAHNFRLKGAAETLRSAGKLAANCRDLHVVVAGGRRLAGWRRFAASAGLEGRATFVGSVADMVPYYAAADTFVHPTYYDPCSLVILEAAASGLPIVTTRHRNGAAELFRESEEILTIDDPRDHDALVDRIDAVLDARVRTRLGAAARKVAIRNTFDRNVASIVQLYRQKLRRRLAA